MKQNQSSLTSLVSAFGRAYHSKYDSPKIFDDFLAIELLSQQDYQDIEENMVNGIQFFNREVAEKFKNNSDEILKWITQVQLSPTPLARAAYCENILQNEIRFGVKQYAILGAGLDTFAIRHPELESTLEIFEIDHPSTQQFKMQRLDEVNLKRPCNLYFIPMDFKNVFSYEKLLEHNFIYDKTFFSLLGVSYYLTKDELSSLLDHLFAKVPTGSSIVFDYADDSLFEEKGLSNRVENMVKMAAAGGEPMKSSYSLPEMEKLLEKAGLLIYEQLPPSQIKKRYFSNRSDYLTAFETIHYVHAVKK